MTRGAAFLLAGLAAPAVPAAAMCATVMVTSKAGAWALLVFPLFYLVALAAELLLAGPVFLLALRLRLVTWWTSVIAGGALGAAVLRILEWSNAVDYPSLARMTAVGAGAGLVFWLVARLGRESAPV
jgi:hypothetical protein